MARIDKYEPKGGGFRAPLAADMTEAQVDTVLGVGLDVDGHVVIGGGATGIVGVMCMPRQLKAREIADIMTDGDIVEVDTLSPGTVYYIDATTGGISADPDAGGAAGSGAGARIGFTVGEARGTRLVVRVGRYE